jgi:hypothetical protein
MLFAAGASAANLGLLFLPRNKDLYPFERAYLIWHMFVGIGSFLYAIAFGLLIFTDVDRAAWSETLTPSSAISFFLVWGVPAALYRMAHANRKSPSFLRKENADDQ